MPSPDEAADHESGVWLLRALHAYLASASRPAKRFFRRLVHDPPVARRLDEVLMVTRRSRQERGPGERTAFARMQQLRSPEFAAAQARKPCGLIG